MTVVRFSVRRTALMFVISIPLLALVVPTFAQDEDEIANRAAFMRVVDEAFNQGETDILAEILAPEFVGHSPNGDTNREGTMMTIAGLVAAMPDLTMTPQFVLVDGDYVMARAVLSGTFENPLPGPNGAIPPTGQPVMLETHTVYRFNDAHQAVEEWLMWDNLSFLTQLGVLPPPQPAASAMQTDPESVIRQFYVFHNAGDSEAQNALWADDATVTWPDGTVFEGKDEILAAPVSHDQIVISDLVVDGSSVSWISTTGGMEFHLEAVVEDGLIQSMSVR